MKTNGATLFVAILFLIIGIIAASWYIKSRNVCYFLPVKNHNPEYFGKYYWKALHDTVNRIPCPACQHEASSFMVFFHDYVNQKVGHDIHDIDNYNKWLNKLCDLKDKRNEES